jgi:hypothetical protein
VEVAAPELVAVLHHRRYKRGCCRWR